MSAIRESIQRSQSEETKREQRADRHSYRDLMLHLDGSTRDEAVIAAGEAVAGAFEAHLEALFANEIPAPVIFAGDGAVSVSYDLLQTDMEEMDAMAQRLRERLERTGYRHEFRRADALPHELEQIAASMARSVDLAITARPYGDGSSGPALLEAMLFEGAAGVLVVPHGMTEMRPVDVVMIGYRDSPECSRAVSLALPFLQGASQVHLVSVTEGDADDELRREPLADMARHLSRHDVRVEVRHLPDWRHPADALLNEAKMTGAGLLVTGAYGRSRFREWILGGVTRELLKRGDMPLLLAH